MRGRARVGLGVTANLPDFARDLIDAPSHASVASLEADGSPQLTLVWVKRDGDDILFSTLAGRRKTRNWARDPRAALLVYDESAPGTYVEVRGQVSIVDDPDGSLIHELSQKYTGQDFTGVVQGRVIARLTPEHVVTH
jgi:PPOX class probable F420-dependent enzyme